MKSVETLSLAGEWRLALDRADVGGAERWFAGVCGERTARLPGTLPGQGIGDPVTVETPWVGSVFDPSYFTAEAYAPYREPGNIKVPFWLQPETYYAGVAWYQREIEIPLAWADRRVVLELERPHWRTTVWCDERELGARDSLSVPHAYELGPGAVGRRRLTVRVDNREIVDLGENSHSISDHTQGNWNGIVGAIALRATAPVWVADVSVVPDVAAGRLAWSFKVRNRTGGPVSVRMRVAVVGAPSLTWAGELSLAAETETVAGAWTIEDELAAWDEFNPVVQKLTVEVQSPEGAAATPVSFGWREVRREGRQLLINGRKLFLRGTLDCAAYPRTGHPPMDRATWRGVLGTIQAHGLNHVRFHSWCPPEAAFVVADELGLYLQVEAASWPNQGTVVGAGHGVDAWLDAETEHISRAYGNHPSLVLMCACNEPDGPAHEAWLDGWVQRHRARDPRVLYTAGAGWPEVAANDFHIRSEPRVQHWLEGLGSRLNAAPPETCTDYADFIRERAVPVVSHEIGQWCAYPNFAEMAKYTGYLKPRNFEIFQSRLAAHGLADRAHDFLMTSGALQALCYKEDIEAALRTTEMGGFQLLGLSDFPGQGTALVGVLDAFWEPKGYLEAATWRRFCGPTVPLARLERRVFTTEDHLVADVEVAHYGAAPLRDDAAAAAWTLRDEMGRAVCGGTWPVRDIAVGGGNVLGRIEVPLGNVVAPAGYRLEVAVGEVVNDWQVWVYPGPGGLTTDVPDGVVLVERWDDEVLAQLQAGRTVVWMIPPAQVAPDPVRGPIALGFTSIFWNTAWTNGQAPHTLGIWCDPDHPALAAFPTEAHSNWQWWYVVRHAAAMILDALPSGLRPIVQVVDDWVTNRKLGLVWEARVGAGRLLVTSVDLRGELDPVRRQLRASLLQYAGRTPAVMAPTVEVDAGWIERIWRRG